MRAIRSARRTVTAIFGDVRNGTDPPRCTTPTSVSVAVPATRARVTPERLRPSRASTSAASSPVRGKARTMGGTYSSSHASLNSVTVARTRLARRNTRSASACTRSRAGSGAPGGPMRARTVTFAGGSSGEVDRPPPVIRTAAELPLVRRRQRVVGHREGLGGQREAWHVDDQGGRGRRVRRRRRRRDVGAQVDVRLGVEDAGDDRDRRPHGHVGHRALLVEALDRGLERGARRLDAEPRAGHADGRAHRRRARGGQLGVETHRARRGLRGGVQPRRLEAHALHAPVHGGRGHGVGEDRRGRRDGDVLHAHVPRRRRGAGARRGHGHRRGIGRAGRLPLHRERARGDRSGRRRHGRRGPRAPRAGRAR